MAATVTQVTIVNLALSHIAIKAISSITDGSVAQVEVSKVWDFTLKETLRSFNWGFAKVQAALTVTTLYDPAVYTYAYIYPTGCEAIRKVNVQTSLDEAISGKYEIMYDSVLAARRIVTDIEDAYIEYTALVEDVTLFDSHFIAALARALASKLAVSLNGDTNQEKEQIAIFNTLISEAQRHNAGERLENHEGNEKSAFVDARD